MKKKTLNLSGTLIIILCNNPFPPPPSLLTGCADFWINMIRRMNFLFFFFCWPNLGILCVNTLFLENKDLLRLFCIILRTVETYNIPLTTHQDLKGGWKLSLVSDLVLLSVFTDSFNNRISFVLSSCYCL